MTEETTIKNLLPEAIKKEMSELHLEKLQEAFDAAVEKKVQGQIAVAVKAAEADFDAQVNERLEKLVNKMEEANKADFVRAVSALNERVQKMRGSYENRISVLKERANEAISKKNALVKEANQRARVAQKNLITETNIHTGRIRRSRELMESSAKAGLLSVAKHYRKQLKENANLALRTMNTLKKRYRGEVMREAKRFQKNLVESVGAYLDREIERKVPYKSVREAVRNRTAMKLVESLKTMLSVDAVSKMEVIKAPIMEAKQIITESKKENNSLINENNRLHDLIAEKNDQLQRQMNESKAQLNKARAALKEAKRIAYLNEKLSTIPSTEQRQFVKNIMADQPIEFIKENWEYTVKQYRTRKQSENDVLAERAKAERKSRQLTEVSRRRLTEAARNVRENRERQVMNESVEMGQQSQIDALIDQITEENGWM